VKTLSEKIVAGDQEPPGESEQKRELPAGGGKGIWKDTIEGQANFVARTRWKEMMRKN